MEAGWNAARKAISGGGGQGAGQAAGSGGTSILKDVWKGFSQSGVDPNGMTTIFSVAPFVLMLGAQQYAYGQDPIYGVEGKDDVFTFSDFPRVASAGNPLIVDLPLEPPLDTIVEEPPKKTLPPGAVRFVTIDGKPYFVIRGPEDYDEEDDGAPPGVSVNLCRDKLLRPPIDWTEPDAALPVSPKDDELPARSVRLPR
jgi:hypothetical protein